MPQPVDTNGTPIGQRTPTPIGDTASVSPGTMTTAPSVPPSGPTGTAPVVAVNTVHRYTDPVFMLNAFLCLSGVVTAVVDVLPSNGPINWSITGPKVLLAVFGAVTSFLRQRTNTVLK